MVRIASSPDIGGLYFLRKADLQRPKELTEMDKARIAAAELKRQRKAAKRALIANRNPSDV